MSAVHKSRSKTRPSYRSRKEDAFCSAGESGEAGPEKILSEVRGGGESEVDTGDQGKYWALEGKMGTQRGCSTQVPPVKAAHENAV